jgi:hypothetical protein
MDVSSKLHTSATLTPGRSPDFHWIRGWVDLRAGLGVFGEEKYLLTLTGLEPRCG